MTTPASRGPRVLAIDPTSRGFAYAVLEGRRFLVDWGLVYVPRANLAQSLRRISHLLRRYGPQVVAIEDVSGLGTRRRDRARELLDRLQASLARRPGIQCVTVSRQWVHLALPGEATAKYEIAVGIVQLFPELMPTLPRRRRPWMSEDDRINVFDAVAFALVALKQLDRRAGASRDESRP